MTENQLLNPLFIILFHYTINLPLNPWHVCLLLTIVQFGNKNHF